jgi:hypothetical protein
LQIWNEEPDIDGERSPCDLLVDSFESASASAIHGKSIPLIIIAKIAGFSKNEEICKTGSLIPSLCTY